jgi:hypothetical protein
METSYLPVQYVFREVIDEEIARGSAGKIFYFDPSGNVASLEGTITELQEIAGKGLYIKVAPEGSIRIDRIITLFGKPGAAFDEYDAYANACMDCSGGD